MKHLKGCLKLTETMLEKVVGGLTWRDEAELKEFIRIARSMQWSRNDFMLWMRSKYAQNTPDGWIDKAAQYVSANW